MNVKHMAAVLSLFLATQPLFAGQAVVAKKSSVTPPLVQTHKINLNKADVFVITGSVKGIGDKRAEAIVAYREAHQGFKSIDELAQVKGIGERFVERNRDKLQEVFAVK